MAEKKEFIPTPEQGAVIDEKRSNILVSCCKDRIGDRQA